MNAYIVVGTIQGTGCDADKFYDVAWEYRAENIEEAKAEAAKDHMFIERTYLLTARWLQVKEGRKKWFECSNCHALFPAKEGMKDQCPKCKAEMTDTEEGERRYV